MDPAVTFERVVHDRYRTPQPTCPQAALASVVAAGTLFGVGFASALVIFAHPDDAEYMCGGTVAAWARDGTEVRYCVITDGSEPSLTSSRSPTRSGLGSRSFTPKAGSSAR